MRAIQVVKCIKASRDQYSEWEMQQAPFRIQNQTLYNLS